MLEEICVYSSVPAKANHATGSKPILKPFYSSRLRNE